MSIYTISKPSANMNMSVTELNRMVHEQEVQRYNEEQERIKRESAAMQRELSEGNKRLLEYETENAKTAISKNEFLTNVKNAFLTECIVKLYKDSFISPLTKNDTVIARNLASNFVTQEGAGELIRRFATKNILLSEFARITTKYYDKVLEDCMECNDPEKAGKSRDFVVSDEVRDDFFDELEDVDTSDASKLIKERVSDAVSDFVDTNAAQKMEYEDVIKSAQDKITSTTNEAYVEEYNTIAKRTINEMKLNKKKNLFHYMVESLSKRTFKDDKLKQKYLHEASLQIDDIVNDSMLVYSFLETLNTVKAIDVNEEYLKEYVTSLA